MTQESTVSLVPIGASNLGEVDAVFDELTAYSMHVDGVSRRSGAASALANAIPPGWTIRDKHAFLARHQGAAVGLLDLIDGYPLRGTAFIGLLAVRESAHGKGLGRALYLATEQLARERLGARTLRLAVVESNPVIGFWTKMGFRPTGEVKPYQGEATSSRAVLMEKSL